MAKGSKNSLANRGKVEKYFFTYKDKEIEIVPAVFEDFENKTNYIAVQDKVQKVLILKDDGFPFEWSKVTKIKK